MNDTPRLKLIEIVARYGKTVTDDPRQLQGLLLDHCGECRREIRALMDAVNEGIPRDLSTASGAMPPAVLIANLTRRLLDKLPLAEDMARWAVETWAIAFGVIALPSNPSSAETQPPLTNPAQPRAAPVVVPQSTPVIQPPLKASIAPIPIQQPIPLPRASLPSSSPAQVCACCQTPIPAGALFCLSCASAIAPKTCFHCGFGQVPDAAKCCPKCGKLV
jgi:hypothetical protein